MTDLTPSAAELAAITLNGHRLTPEQSSWLVGSLQHERAYCSTPGELLELLSHPTPPPAPEVAPNAATILGSAVEVANIREAADLVRHIDEGYHYRRLRESAAVLEAHAEGIIATRNERDAETQRADAAERELAISRAETENVRTNLICVIEERDEAKEALKTAQYGYRTMRGMLAKERTSTPPAAPSELAEELITEIMEYADPEGGKAHQLMLRAASFLSRAPGSEAPMVAALRERVRELKYALRDVFSEAREHIPEDLAKDARAQIDFDESTLTPLPASPAAGKEAM